MNDPSSHPYPSVMNSRLVINTVATSATVSLFTTRKLEIERALSAIWRSIKILLPVGPFTEKFNIASDDHGRT